MRFFAVRARARDVWLDTPLRGRVGRGLLVIFAGSCWSTVAGADRRTDPLLVAMVTNLFRVALDLVAFDLEVTSSTCSCPASESRLPAWGEHVKFRLQL